jgi:hypothetical protein
VCVYAFPKNVAKPSPEIITNIHVFSKDGCSDFPRKIANSPVFPLENYQFFWQRSTPHLKDANTQILFAIYSNSKNVRFADIWTGDTSIFWCSTD